VSDVVAFLGGQFKVAERVSTLAVMRFAKIASAGVDADDMEGLAAMYDLLEQCIDPADWRAFQAHADKERAQGDDLLGLIREVMARITARPTGQPSDSSDGLESSSENSVGDSYLRVIARLEGQGRPDLALMVDRAQDSRVSA
jgi:hypothetical protein